MYPIINSYETENQIDTQSENDFLKKSLIFDFGKNRIVMEAGSPLLSQEQNLLINQWLEWLIRTVPTKYKMYSNEFGVDTDSIIGGKMKDRALQIGMIEESIRNNIYKCPVISEITNFQTTQTNTELKIYFEIITNTGERKGVELAV